MAKKNNKSEHEYFKDYLRSVYGYDLPEAKVQEHKQKAIALLNRFMEIDIDEDQMKKIRKVLELAEQMKLAETNATST